jgi:hypothetical protein
LETGAALADPASAAGPLAAALSRHGAGPRVAVLSDGRPEARELAKALGWKAGPGEPRLLLDQAFLAGPLGRLGESAFPLDPAGAGRWAAARLAEIESGRPGAAVLAVKAVGGPESENFLAFMAQNVDIMDYQYFIRNKFLINSLNAHKPIHDFVKSHFGQANMTWKIENAKNVLILMSKKLSNLWYDDVVKPVMEKYRQSF